MEIKLKNGQTLEIYQDEHGESPREWDNMCQMICFHKRYNLGDKHDIDHGDYNGWNELKEENAFVAVDMVGAGDGEVVLVTNGSNACADGSIASAQKRIPIDASITGILDNLSVDGKFTFKK